MYVCITKPPNFDPSKKYPVVLDVYGGPNSNRVKRALPEIYYHYSSCEMIAVTVDGRGSGNRGWNMRAPVYKNLGLYEATDTIAAIKHPRFFVHSSRSPSDEYSYFDKSKIGIFGWSYGGFLSTYVAALDQGKTIKCAAAVAPVTNFVLYDTAYTERYMGLFEENPHGYNQSNLVNKYAQLANVRYLLAHGEADDNVHYQNSALLSEALQTHDIHFTQLVYTNQAHSLDGAGRHVAKEIKRFLRECLDLPSN